MNNKKLWEAQKKALRDPREVWTFSEKSGGVHQQTLKYHADKNFVELLASLGITLFISREYENLLISIHSDGARLHQTYIPLAHPSGIACDRENRLMYVASTRNPNIIYQFKSFGEAREKRSKHSHLFQNPMLVARKKYYPGMYYFHDLALISGKLYGNAVGMNGIVNINLNHHEPEQVTWHPKCTEDSKGFPKTDANYIQLNSIASGRSLEESFFSASGEKISYRRPGHLNYPVDKRGVIISGKTRNTLARGLTRPHSARLYKGKIWVANSGYGEFGFIRGESFEPVIKLKGWTRGVCIHNNIAFVASSRIIPQYRHYAPGLQGVDDKCGLYAISLSSGKIVGKVMWPSGNQVFAIDYLSKKVTSGLLQKKIQENQNKFKLIAYNNN